MVAIVLDIAVSKTFITMFVPYLVDWVVDYINFSLKKSGSDHASPYFRFTGNPVSMVVHFRAAFLDIGAVNEITDDLNNLDSRARLGFVIDRDESNRGTLIITTVIILDFATGRTMKCRHFKLVEHGSKVHHILKRRKPF